MNALISASPLSVVPVRAVTMYVPAWPALVMNRLEPSMTQQSPSRRAVVRVPPASEPAPGSVSPYAPRTVPLAIGTRKRCFCSGGAGEVERPAAERGVRRDDEPERAPDPADLLDRDRVGERVEPRAALVLGDRDAEPAELADAPHDVDREAPLALVLVDDGRDLGRP